MSNRERNAISVPTAVLLTLNGVPMSVSDVQKSITRRTQMAIIPQAPAVAVALKGYVEDGFVQADESSRPATYTLTDRGKAAAEQTKSALRVFAA